MALDQFALLELVDMPKAVADGDLMRRKLQSMLQA